MGSLDVKNLVVNYSEKKVIKNITFHQKEGEIIVILGASGDGKTTLLKSIAGLLIRDKGEIEFDDRPVLDPSEQLVPGNPFIKLVNQDFCLDDYHTVEENIGLRLLAYDNVYKQQRIDELLRITSLSGYRSKKALELSGGQRQRLAIARALADEPELVLLDEPFNQLDFQTKNKIATHIRRYLSKNKIGAIMVTHNGIEALEWADRILLLENGKITRDSIPEDFYNKPRTVKEARFFGEINRVNLDENEIYFRPSFYKLKADKLHQICLDIEYKSKQNLGWYTSFRFKCGNRFIELYSTTDISKVKRVFIRKLFIE